MLIVSFDYHIFVALNVCESKVTERLASQEGGRKLICSEIY